MYIRRFSVAVISTLVGYGAYYTYKTTGAGNQHAIARSFGSSSSAAAAAGTASSPTIASTASGSAAAQQTRSVLVIGADELFTGTYVGEGPITKETDGEGRTVVEIITPDEATRALRRTEQSFLVNRGQGVVRYDLVQLPSNNPIEDDHAEKIIELPNRPDKPDDPLANGDWMFWGVYDGHS